MRGRVIDSHAHLDFPSFNRDREEVIQRAIERGVLIINSGIDLGSNKRTLSLFRDLDGVWITFGQSPNDLRDLKAVEKNIEFIRRHADDAIAIGEIGLDFYRERREEMREIQRKVFLNFLNLAEELEKPVVIHAREAEREAFEMIPEGIKAVFHCYGGTPELAEEIVRRGHLISISTLVCFSKRHQEIARALEDGFTVETDSPFLSPRRGMRNEPVFVLDAVEKISEIKGVEKEEIERRILRETRKFFEI
ncbi:MAG: TatD DNase family protein [Archaeoglobi archaeon]|nr:TatD DNase family protein [Archaeoglobi archaeon]MDK2781710.1 TatD DNase family protein [Archaeoglobi archaeon]